MMRLIVSLVLLRTVLCDSDEVAVRIFNGRTAAKGKFPYQAYIYYTNSGGLLCGASIIHKRWLLTAAHCKVTNNVDDLRIKVGSIYNYGYNRESDGQIIRIEKFIQHENYVIVENHNPTIIFNDIALIRLAKDIEFSETVEVIKLAKNDSKTYENVTATASGWGDIDKSQNLAPVLQYIHVKVINETKCKQKTRTIGILFNHVICTSLVDGKIICHGDSGGPLAFEDKLIGVASAGDRYCDDHIPNIYTRVTTFVPWINQQLQSYSDTLP